MIDDLLVKLPDRAGKSFREGVTTGQKAAFFAQARASAKHGHWGKDFPGSAGYKPTLGGLIVVNDGDPSDGFAMRQDAIRAAQRFRAGAAKFLASVDTLPKGQDAQQGLAGTESGAVPAGQTPKHSQEHRQPPVSE